MHVNQFLFGLIAVLLFAILAVGTTDIVLREWPTGSLTAGGGGETATTTPQTPRFTLAEVATHNSRQSCYAAIRGSVYDLTGWIDKHPGGPQRILSLCGKDGTSAFTNQHEGQPRPEEELASLKIGVLAP